MKRRKPLQRKTPMRRSGPLKRSGALKPRSKRQSRAEGTYEAAKRKSEKVCVCCGSTWNIDPHHYSGRGPHILEFVWICHEFHDAIHANPNKAYELGWLTAAYRGYAPRTEPEPWLQQPEPNKCLKLITEVQTPPTTN